MMLFVVQEGITMLIQPNGSVHKEEKLPYRCRKKEAGVPT